VIARDQHLGHPAVAVERGGGAHPVLEHRARASVAMHLGAEHQRGLRGARGGGIARPSAAAQGHDRVGRPDDHHGAGQHSQGQADQASAHHEDRIRCLSRASCHTKTLSWD
jgi:hypothetical protein